MAKAKNAEVHVIRGKASFAKILGDPIPNYNKDGKEWKMDVEITKDSIKELKDLGIGDRVKKKDDYLDGKPFLTFKHKEFKTNGEPNQPVKVVDAAGNNWDQSNLIGNGSDVDVKFAVVDWGPGKKHGVYMRSVRVLNHIPYEQKEFEELDENDEFYDNVKKAEEEAARRERELAQFRKDFDIEEGEADVEDEPAPEEDALDDELPM